MHPYCRDSAQNGSHKGIDRNTEGTTGVSRWCVTTFESKVGSGLNPRPLLMTVMAVELELLGAI